MAYHVCLPQFEGPLDLLLSLIEKEKLDITELSLAQVTDQYLASLRDGKNLTLGHLGDFLTVAAQLILIKSRALLPILSVTEEEELSLQDLEERLRWYQRFREAAKTLEALFQRNRPAYVRESYTGVSSVFYPPQDLQPQDLRARFSAVLGALPVEETLPEQALQSTITLEEKILIFQEHLAERLESSFAMLTQNAATKVEVIISFLAVLELVKQSFLLADQQHLFMDIHLKRNLSL